LNRSDEVFDSVQPQTPFFALVFHKALKPFWFVVLAESRIDSLSRLSATVSHNGLDLSRLPGSPSLPHFMHSFLSVLAPCAPCDLTIVLVQIQVERGSTDPNTGARLRVFSRFKSLVCKCRFQHESRASTSWRSCSSLQYKPINADTRSALCVCGYQPLYADTSTALDACKHKQICDMASPNTC
jgi:hypothetical protein